MIKISRGKIKLEDRLLDLSTFEIRPKVTNQDLEIHYDSFIEHAEEIGDYFEKRKTFDKIVKDITDEKRPKLISRETKYPFMWAFRTKFMPLNFLTPSKRRLHDKYFMGGRCITNMPMKIKKESEETHLDMKLREDIGKKFERFPGYEGILEIPNDTNSPEAKSITFHEALHYLVSRYQVETERNFVDSFTKKKLSQLNRYQFEHIIHEHFVEILTDKLLTHDPDAQFENRWLHYASEDVFTNFVTGASIISTGIILGFSISKPYLLPLTLVSEETKNYTLNKYKESMKNKILEPREYPVFKI